MVIENKDFEKLIKQYDRPVSFFYCDPPYYATEDHYADVGFTKENHIRLRDRLLDIDGKFLVSYNDCPEICTLWDKSGIRIESIERLNNPAQRSFHDDPLRSKRGKLRPQRGENPGNLQQHDDCEDCPMREYCEYGEEREYGDAEI